MPFVVTTILFALVGAYALGAGAAALAFLTARNRSLPGAPTEWPPVTVVPSQGADPGALRDALASCEYPTDRVEVTHSDASASTASGSAPTSDNVILTLPPGAEVPPEWPRSMVRPCQTDASVVVGPTLVRHDNLFLPRLEALQHLGRLTRLGGTAHLGLPIAGTANRALNADARPSASSSEGPAPLGPPPTTSLTFNPAPEAAVTRSAAGSFVDLLRRQAERFHHALRTPSRFVQAQAIGRWGINAVLLACSAVAIVLPAWRQPALVALLGKMGADVLLAVPAASHFGERGLLRSIVVTVLVLMVSTSLAGGWALVGSSKPNSLDRAGVDT
ncbi:hypothetical protein [Salinibacter altiplanensis]|uniref:hypothetical protein n=1 Tax=Salinibacter altiplanensis TaxID=1803181 RepID=UPI000C9F184F|nr:hypothetical protein [Salinibacter altiplanensis]